MVGSCRIGRRRKTMTSKSNNIQRLAHRSIILLLHPSIISSTNGAYSRPNSQEITLCFNLASPHHGSYGSQTVSVTKDDSEWLLQYPEVTIGACTTNELYDNIRNIREWRQVTYCHHFGPFEGGMDYNTLCGPRFLENFMFDKGAWLGECMPTNNDNLNVNGGDGGMEQFSSGTTELESQQAAAAAVVVEDMVSLCLHLPEYGPQTIVVLQSGANWLLDDYYNNDTTNNNFNVDVTVGPCNTPGETLYHHEIEAVTYCKHFGPLQSGYDYEIRAPRFMSDYLYEVKRATLGTCLEDDPRRVDYYYVPSYNSDISNLRKEKDGRSRLKYIDGTSTTSSNNIAEELAPNIDDNHRGLGTSSAVAAEPNELLCSCVDNKPNLRLNQHNMIEPGDTTRKQQQSKNQNRRSRSRSNQSKLRPRPDRDNGDRSKNKKNSDKRRKKNNKRSKQKSEYDRPGKKGNEKSKDGSGDVRKPGSNKKKPANNKDRHKPNYKYPTNNNRGPLLTNGKFNTSNSKNNLRPNSSQGSNNKSKKPNKLNSHKMTDGKFNTNNSKKNNNILSPQSTSNNEAEAGRPTTSGLTTFSNINSSNAGVDYWTSSLWYYDSGNGLCKPNNLNRPSWLTALYDKLESCCAVSWNRNGCLRHGDPLANSMPVDNTIVYYSNEPINYNGNYPMQSPIQQSSFANEFANEYTNLQNERDTLWLIAHNVRRHEWHTNCGKSYVPLRWSTALADESKVFAVKLLQDSCGDLYHDPNNVHGENIASHSGTGSWAELRTPDSILTRWVEDEKDLHWPEVGHLTQAIWRATKYVGCAEASKPRVGGGMCHTQVCRYAKPGNCDMNSYRTNADDWWYVPMMMDDSPCGPECPPEGC